MKFSKLLLAGAVLTLTMACNRDGRKLGQNPLNRPIPSPAPGDKGFVGPVQSAPSDLVAPSSPVVGDTTDVLGAYSEEKITLGSEDVSNCLVSSCDGLWKLAQMTCDGEVLPMTSLQNAAATLEFSSGTVVASYLNGDRKTFNMTSDEDQMVLEVPATTVGFESNQDLGFGGIYKYGHKLHANHLILTNLTGNTTCPEGKVETFSFTK